MPLLVDDILENSFDPATQSIENAIYFKHAYAELSRLLVEDDKLLLTQLSKLEQQEKILISDIGSKKAWLSVLERLSNNDSLRQHLIAWIQAVSRIGRTGTGRNALRYRGEAQQQMEHCIDSIPCWVMPLYKVSETISPKQGMFDYVIVDEASQLGADTIFLLYISKNIIIVGDDKQTSPEYIGVEAGAMTPYILQHLQNIPFANYYNTDFSFFDHAKRFCEKEIILREHFRCMPEIIAFCNKWFYAPDGKGLYPLKQYSENRLEPLQNVYCEKGYTDSSGSNISNKVEAKAIADKIAELIKNGKYREKSFGVISLQGNKQAELIDNLVKTIISDEEYNSRQIKCGNSASFQGDERDIMFLSLVTANNHKRSAFTNPEDERRFNVAVSRAKEQVWLFHSVTLQQLINKADLRYKLLDHFINYKDQQKPINTFIPRTLGNQPSPFDSWFEVDVFNDIVNHNYSVIPQYKVANYRIDLVILLPNGVKIAIECDGDKFHTRDDYEKDMYRQKVLERCGWQFFRVRGSEYYYNRIKALEPLWLLLSKNEVKTPEPEIINIPNIDEHETPANIVIEPEKPHAVKNPVIKIKDKPNIKKPSHIPDNTKQTEIFDSQKQRIPLKNGIKKSKNLFSFLDILVFTSEQNVYKVKNEGFKTLSEIKVPFKNGEQPVYVAGTDNYSGYLLVAFENGRIAKINFTSYKTKQNSGRLKKAYSNESKLVFIEHIENDLDLVVASNIEKIILFNTELINANNTKDYKGIQVMKLQNETIMKTVKTFDKVKINNPEFFRRTTLNAVGYNLKQGDKIQK